MEGNLIEAMELTEYSLATYRTSMRITVKHYCVDYISVYMCPEASRYSKANTRLMLLWHLHILHLFTITIEVTIREVMCDRPDDRLTTHLNRTSATI
jgi:hypothetical protein